MQIWFIVAIATACLTMAISLLWLASETPFATRLTLLGMVVGLAFVLIRAASFHHIDRFIEGTTLGLKWNWLLEMSDISIVIVASKSEDLRLADESIPLRVSGLFGEKGLVHFPSAFAPRRISFSKPSS